jgi:VWFA-related protein
MLDRLRFVRKQIPIFLIALTCLSLLAPVAASAQVGIRNLDITLVDEADFPAVDIYFSVNDLDGQPVTGLTDDNFTLYEDDVSVPITTLSEVEHPMLIGVVIDSAVSFNTWEGGAPRVEKAKEAARWLVAPEHGRLIPDDEVGVFAFQDGAPERLVSFSWDHQMVVNQGIDPVSTAGNQYTALFDILRQAIQETSTYEGARRRALLVFSDGVDQTSGTEIESVIQEAVDAHLLIYTVGMGGGLAHDREGSAFLRSLANETGGEYFWYRPGRADAEEEMKAFLDRLVAQRAGYTLTYESRQYEGTPELRLEVTSGGTTAEDTVSFEVPSLPPVVTIDALEEGQILEGNVEVEPSISRAQREIDHVEYWLNDELVYTAHAAPWSFEWDTSEYATSTTDADVYDLKVVACDIRDKCSDVTMTLGTRLLPPTPTPAPPVVPTPDPTMSTIQLAVSIGALVIAISALVIIFILMRRGGFSAVQNVAAEVRRRTRVWRQRTNIFGGGQPGARQSFAKLTVVSDMFEGKEFPIEENKVFLGRDEQRADIILYWNDYISGRHAQVAQEGDKFYVWDLNSSNGTWVDGQRVSRSLSEGVELEEARTLNPGSILRLGPDLRLRFDLVESEQGQEQQQDEGEPESEGPSGGDGHRSGEAPTQILGRAEEVASSDSG